MSDGERQFRVAVLGAGISGLAAAWKIKKMIPDAHVEIWEKSDRVGGVIQTKNIDGFQLELSTDNFITTVPQALELCKELGFSDDDLARTNNSYRRTFVERKGRLYPLPDGFMTMAPTKLWPMATTPILSPMGKIRCAFDLVLPRKTDGAEESLAAFTTRRLGREAFERLVEPLVGGIYGGDARRLSLQATLPRFAEMEKRDRSLIWAMKKTQRAAKKIKREEESGARYSFFVTLKPGLQALPERLAARLVEAGAQIEFGREVARVDRTGYAWILTDAAGRTACFDAVICALPARSAGAPLRCCSPQIASFFEATECTGTAIVHLAYKKEQIRRPVLGMGFVVPTSEKNGLIAGSFSSFKYPYRAPDGTTLLRIFVGGARAPELLEAPEEELIARVSGETRKLFDVAGEPILTDVARWPQTMPQYYIGRLDMIKKLRSDLERYPGLGVAGNALDGVGVPACIQSGYSAAEDVVRKLSASEFSGLAAHNC